MKNSECEIHIISNESGWTQKYRKDKNDWIQITNGVTRYLTSDQLLSHILPLLVDGQKKFKVIVIPGNWPMLR
jgi:hypothetical protein